MAVLAVPFYVARAAGEASTRDDAVFDHPTPLGAPPTLPRLLQSLGETAPADSTVVVVVAHTHPAIAARADAWAREVVATWHPPRGLRALLLDSVGATRLRDALSYHGPLLAPTTYSGVRNLCLMASLLLKAEAAVLLDDDEVVSRRDFVERALSWVAPSALPTADAVGGLYLEDGRAVIKEAPYRPWHAAFDPATVRHQAFAKLVADGAPVAAPFAFGGNLTLSRRLMEALPFDPAVPRGEDVDYVISARLHGFRVVLDPDLYVDHYPPPKAHAEWRCLLEDGVRFLSERRKLETARQAGVYLPDEALDPYPGQVLGADLGERLAQALATMAREAARQGRPGDAAGAREAGRNLATVERQLAQRNLWSEYGALVVTWHELLTSLPGATPFLTEVSPA